MIGTNKIVIKFKIVSRNKIAKKNMILRKIFHKNKIYVARTRRSDDKIHSFQENDN